MLIECAFLSVLVMGCGHVVTTGVAGNDPISRIEVRREIIEQDTKHAQAVAMKGDIAAAVVQMDDARSAFADTQEKYDGLVNKWYVKWGRKIEAFLWLIVIFGGIALVGSILKDTAFATGWGSIPVLIYRAFLACITGGMYLIGLIGRGLVNKFFPQSH
jgi:hypothetical protein